MKRIVRIVVVSVLLLAAIVAGGSLYMLSYSLQARCDDAGQERFVV